MFAFAMLSSLCFEQLNSPNYPPMETTLPLYWRFGSTWKLGPDHLQAAVAADHEDKDPLFSPPATAAATTTTQVVLRRRKRQQKLDKSRRKSTPPAVCNGSQEADQTFALRSTALRQTLALKSAQLSSYSARLFSQQLGLPTTEGYKRMPPSSSPHRAPLESEHKLFSQLQRLFRSRYARLNEIPSFSEADDFSAGGAEEEETRTVVTYISLTDQHASADPNGCCLPEGKGNGEGGSVSGQLVLANTKGVRLRIPVGRSAKEQKRHISWKDLAWEAEGSVRQMLVSPVLSKTDPAREAEGSKRCIASGLNSRHQRARLESQRRSTFSCTAELSSQLTTTTTATAPREDRHRMQIQQIKRLIASQRRCHKWFFTLYEFDKPENAEETAKLESSLFNIIINRLHWIYALSVSDLFIPTGREATGEAHLLTPCHDNTILTKFAVTQQQVDKRLRFKVRRLSRRSHTNPAATQQDLGHHPNRPPRYHHGGESRKRFDPARNLFAYSLLQEQSPSPRTHSAERGPGDGDPSSLVLPPKSSPLNTDATTVPPARISCVHYAMFSHLSPHNPGQLICGDGGEVAGSCGGADTAIAQSKVYCSDCGRNIMTGCSSVASTAGSSDLGAVGSSRRWRHHRRLKCTSSEDSLLCATTSRSRTKARARGSAAATETTICYAMSRSVEFCSTLRQLRSEQVAAGHSTGRMTFPHSAPTGCLLEPRWWPHREGTHVAEPTTDREAVKAHASMNIPESVVDGVIGNNVQHLTCAFQLQETSSQETRRTPHQIPR